MNFKKIIFASLIYIIWAVLINYFVPLIAIWAAIIAALAAGIYVGYGSKASDALTGGVIAGLIGGLTTGVVSIYIPSFYGIPTSVSISGFSPVIQLIETTLPFFSASLLAIVGLVFGGIGGLLGSNKKLKSVFLFLILFTLFIFYGAIDNMVWNWGRIDWTWNMSISHVLTNRIDLFVAVIFAIFVTILYNILKVEE
jgi:hypothetical protein